MHRIIHSDIIEYLQNYPDYAPKFQGIFADPPYYLGSITNRFGSKDSKPASTDNNDGAFSRLSKGFMGQTWDGFESEWHYMEWVHTWAKLLLKVAYPGAILFMFGGSRTYDLLTVGLRLAGWEIYDCIHWLYGSGFPKGNDISKDIDKRLGAERTVKRTGKAKGVYGAYAGDNEESLPESDEAQRWYDYKTLLKPAYEPIVFARGPRQGYTFAECAMNFGTGALNIGGGRIDRTHAPKHSVNSKKSLGKNASPHVYGDRPRFDTDHTKGGYPANVIADGGLPDGIANYFYSAKAHSWERDAGLDDFESVHMGMSNGAQIHGEGYDKGQDIGYNRVIERKNDHPTVKPIELTHYLATLIKPPQRDEPNRLLIPFSGVASEMIGAMLAGWDDITGVEMTDSYIPIAEARLQWWSQFSSVQEAKAHYDSVRRGKQADQIAKENGQLSLF